MQSKEGSTLKEGDLSYQVILIDPKRCKPWSYHNRDTAWLTEKGCQDLIISIKRYGQHQPILVRPLLDDPQHDFEIIYGVRRWFACSVIANQKVLARVSNIDDKTAMILMHSENADSKDISEFERAVSFSKQMKSGLFKNQTELAKAMGLTQGTISKMIKAAEIFEYLWIRILFRDKLDIPVKLAYTLYTLLNNQETFDLIKLEAEMCHKAQEKTHIISPARDTLKQLIKAAKLKTDEMAQTEKVLLMVDNKPLVSCQIDKFGKIAIIIEKNAKNMDRAAIERACIKAITDYVFV